MKTITTKILSYEELNDEAKDAAVQALIERNVEDFLLLEGSSQEILDSMKAIAEAMGGKLTDYAFGSYCQNYKMEISLPDSVECRWRYDWVEHGNKLVAVFTRMLVNHGYPRAKHFKDQEFPGICGFTGVCWDDALVEAIHQALLQGDSWTGACNAAAYRACQMLEAEREYRCSEEHVRGYLDEQEEQFLEDGSLYL